ncbi:hypothetical protein [Sinosporangium siamense]|uniref:Uncharacterized protein n=1 Tax=Sinosporangium siamense TaxID=1367973 RepID=A0A919RQT8_9ACTN|nr:hypothetical protein [Sinosporangium siamense]GII96549.1 hypothetical protein Ssi02_67800 [Sinosporangium siamense]
MPVITASTSRTPHIGCPFRLSCEVEQAGALRMHRAAAPRESGDVLLQGERVGYGEAVSAVYGGFAVHSY